MENSNNNSDLELAALKQETEEKSSFDFAAIYTTLVLNWKWFVLSIIICMGAALIYLRYATPIYQTSAKLLVKDDDNNKSSSSSNLQNITNLGIISNSNGFDNEMEILTSHSLAAQTVEDLKLYAEYYHVGKVKNRLVYKTQPFCVDMDKTHLRRLNTPISLIVERTKDGYHVTGTYRIPINENEASDIKQIDQTLSSLPATFATNAGYIEISPNPDALEIMKVGEEYQVFLVSPRMAAQQYVNELGVTQTSKTTTIAELTINDADQQRSIDYLNQLAICYNRQANEDKNLIAERTEKFINIRLAKINAELGNTDGAIESYKRKNGMVELKINGTQAATNADAYQQKLADAQTQVSLINSMAAWLNQPSNRYQTLPSNVGLEDQAATDLINKYNDIVLERNRLLRSASETSPSVTPLTAQLNELSVAIRRAMNQARRNLEITRNAVASQYGTYQNQVVETPEQERALTQIGRQQEVKSGLYLMLLQKREENSISLAATADKGKLIDSPQYIGKVSPKSSIILLVSLIISVMIPAIILFLLQFLHYKIEGHQDVVRLTKLPILGDIPIASESAKTKADIVVHENKNNLMEEIFRSMRTNLQFMLKQDEKVIIFTSSTSGEGKTFTAANLAISFALLGKKAIMVGLDIRKPRLAELFEIDDHMHGITTLLTKDNPTWEEIQTQIIPSGINKNLSLLMAGPTPPNPSELLARESLNKIMQELKNHFDYILIDTAPVGLVTDTLQIGHVANATVYMCRADYTSKDSFGLINNLNDENKLPNMCIAINGIDMSRKKYGYYYGYGKYGRYSKFARYGNYGHYGSYGKYGQYGTYGSYGSYGNYSHSHYSQSDDTSIKK